MRIRRRSVSYLLVAGINPLWKLYPDACKLLLNSKSRGRIRGMLRTSRYPKSYNFGMLLILELINYISLSSSLSASSLSRSWTFPVFLSTSLAFVRWFYPTFPPPPPALPIVSLLHHPSTPYAHTYRHSLQPLSRLPILRHLRASNHSRLSRPGNFMLELTGSMEGTSQRDPHPGRRPVIFHHLHFRATPAALQPLTPISLRNCWRREKFRERERERCESWHGAQTP